MSGRMASSIARAGVTRSERPRAAATARGLGEILAGLAGDSVAHARGDGDLPCIQ